MSSTECTANLVVHCVHSTVILSVLHGINCQRRFKVTYINKHVEIVNVAGPKEGENGGRGEKGKK